MAARTEAGPPAPRVGQPTILKRGSPGEISTSTSIIAPSNPKIAQLLTLSAYFSL